MKNRLTISLCFVPFFFLMFFSLSRPGLCQSELEWANTYNIEISEDCVARWIIERKTYLETIYDEASFSYYSSLDYHYELSKNISALVKDAALKTGRWDMTNGPLTITSSVFRSGTISYGVITYQYDWTKFANSVQDNDRIEIGDTFVNGVLLFGKGELTIEYPSEYVIVDVSPTPEEIIEFNHTVVWRELEIFSVEEISIVLERKSFIDILREYRFLIAGVIAAVGVSSVGFWLLRARRKEDEEKPVPTERTSFETENDEDRVVRMLKASGESLYQSTITKRCGFSKSKTSLLLTAMEKRGILKRQKKGREKLVTLIRKDEHLARKDKRVQPKD